MRGLLLPACLLACLVVATGCDFSPSSWSSSIRRTWMELTGGTIPAEKMAEKTNRVIALANDMIAGDGDRDAQRAEATALVDSLDTSFPVADPLDREALLKIIKSDPPARLGSFKYLEPVIVPHESDEKIEFVPPIPFGTSRQYSNVVVQYGDGKTYAMPLIIIDTGEFGLWARVRNRENLFKGELGPSGANMTFEKTITHRGQPWAVTKSKEDGSITYMTMWNDRFRVMVNSSQTQFTDPEFFYNAVNLEYLNQLK